MLSLTPVLPAGADDQAPPAGERPGDAQALRSEIACMKARLALSKRKAFYMVLDAPRGTVTLELGGVPLRACPIEKLELDRRLESRRRQESFSDSLATPFMLLAKAGTIPEIPPPVDADTTRTPEAERVRAKAKFSDADFSFTYDRDIVIHITTRPDTVLAPNALRTRVANRMRLLRLAVRSWMKSGPLGDKGEVFLQIGRTDARALYYALPDSSGLVLRF